MYTIKDKDIYVLLGRERETPGWRQGSHKWSAFSGKVELHETALQAAAREFTEEACACVSLDLTPIPTSAESVAAALRAWGVPVEQSTLVKGERLLYCTYVFRLPYAPFRHVFAETRTRLLELDAVFRHFYRIKKLADIAPRFFLPGFMLSAQLTVANFEVLSDTEVQVTMHETSPACEIDFIFLVTADVASMLRELRTAWQNVVSFIGARSHDPIFQHPAVNVVRSQNRIVSAYVNKAYLEKCEIDWWKLDDLLRARDTHFSQDTPFRRLFLENVPMLARRIFELERANRDCHGTISDTITSATTPIESVCNDDDG